MDVTVSALMTAPRYECTSARNVIESALHSAGVPLSVSGGVYYGQCMQNMLEGLIDKGVDYALTVDFDSVFLASHVQRLLDIIAQEGQIDALASVQPKRNSGAILASTGTAEQLNWSGYPLQVQTAHFGLTVIDLHKLRDIPKPWFLAVPDSEGRWGDERTDADVYFWRRWKEAGNTVYIDPGVRLGHMEEMVTFFDEEMNLQHKYLREWRDDANKTDPDVEGLADRREPDASRRGGKSTGRKNGVCRV